MQKRLLFEGVLLMLVFGSIWGIFTMFPIWPKKSVYSLSIENEKKLGNILLKATLANPDFHETKNDTALAALIKIRKRLTDGIETPHYDYNIILIDNTMVNAFALPGGYIMVTTGLITILNSPEECAAVLAHEIGHIEKRHTISKLLTNFTAAVLFSDNALVSEAAEMLTTSAYSRKQEEDADRFGLELLEKSRINPHIMGTAFRHLKEESGSYVSEIEIIMSHPDIDSRIKDAYDYPVKESFIEEKIIMDWESVQNQFIRPKSQ